MSVTGETTTSLDLAGADEERVLGVSNSPLESETKSKRLFFLVLALAAVAGLGYFIFSFLAPAPGRGGVDENAYLVGARMIAQHGTTGLKPANDYQFVGMMWLRTSGGWYYPKYPFGTSLLYAPAVLLGKPEWAFAVSSLCTCLAVLGLFLLARRLVGSFHAMPWAIALFVGVELAMLALIRDNLTLNVVMLLWPIQAIKQWQMGG